MCTVDLLLCSVVAVFQVHQASSQWPSSWSKCRRGVLQGKILTVGPYLAMSFLPGVSQYPGQLKHDVGFTKLNTASHYQMHLAVVSLLNGFMFCFLYNLNWEFRNKWVLIFNIWKEERLSEAHTCSSGEAVTSLSGHQSWEFLYQVLVALLCFWWCNFKFINFYFLVAYSSHHAKQNIE